MSGKKYSTVASALVFAAFSALFVACATDEAAPRRVLEAKAACEERAKWNPSASPACSECQSYSKQPACACPTSQDFGGACESEASREQQNADCTVQVLTCAERCGTNCDCLDACFVAHGACKTDYAALGVCILETCTKHCQ